MDEPFEGRRLPDVVVGQYGPRHPPPGITPRPGDFWKIRRPADDPENGWWIVLPRGGLRHVEKLGVEEHGDGTITLPLAVVEPGTGCWTLTRGVWAEIPCP